MSTATDIAAANRRLLTQAAGRGGSACSASASRWCRSTSRSARSLGINAIVLQPDALPANTQVDTARTVTIEFDSNTHDLPWSFKPLARSVQVHPGAARDRRSTRSATRSTRRSPARRCRATGRSTPREYFKKMECFCFTQQTLAPGEMRQMPVVFVVDPTLPKDVNTITLSYTFFEVAGRGRGANSSCTAGGPS